MKKLFIVRLSEDGVQRVCFTNVKAVHNYVCNLKYYVPSDIDGDGKYTYARLVQSLQGGYGCIIYCEGHETIEIIEAVLMSSYKVN
jgi:hypothetical protein